MLGVGVGLGVYEFEPPREQDELPPVIFLNAPETFRPKPFMMEQNTCNSERVTLVEPKWMFLPASCSFFLAAKKWEREVSWDQILSKNPMKTREQSLRLSEWMRVECESSTPTSRPLFKGRMARHHWRRQDSMASDRWRRMGQLAVGRGSAEP